jgi:N-acetylglucosamine kinase-like BadF-type ATPase
LKEFIFLVQGQEQKLPDYPYRDIIANFFTNSVEVIVKEDMVAAAYAATTEPGIVCILGTGSNSCYFDGKILKWL